MPKRLKILIVAFLVLVPVNLTVQRVFGPEPIKQVHVKKRRMLQPRIGLVEIPTHEAIAGTTK